MQEEQPQGRFSDAEHWLANVFWFHYKWYYLVGLFAAVFLVLTLGFYFGRVNYDYQVLLVSSSPLEEQQFKSVQKLLSETGEGKREGRPAQVLVERVPLRGETGERPLFGKLDQSDSVFYLLDEESCRFYQALGYFPEATYLPALQLWGALRDVPVIPYTAADFPDVEYTQDQIDESNAYRMEEHRLALERAGQLLERLKAA